METIPRSQNHLGQLLGLSGAMVSKHRSRGMPVNSVEDARAWMQANLDPARRKGSRFDKFYEPHRPPTPDDATPTPRPTTPAAAIETAAPRMREPIHTRPGDESFDAARTREKIAAANLIEIQEAALRGT
ncbi:MAG: hypothetical protein IPN53_25155 [Comamonadaceae bacterium]|nr:hypothetical protein [Comamonadaceae bacterium]